MSSIFDSVAIVKQRLEDSKISHYDVNRIYCLLEDQIDNEDRVNTVVAQILNDVGSNDDFPYDREFANSPGYHTEDNDVLNLSPEDTLPYTYSNEESITHDGASPCEEASFDAINDLMGMQDNEGDDPNNNDPNNNIYYEPGPAPSLPVNQDKDHSMETLLREASIVMGVAPQFTFDAIFSKLTEEKDRVNRLQFVTHSFLNRLVVAENGDSDVGSSSLQGASLKRSRANGHGLKGNKALVNDTIDSPSVNNALSSGEPAHKKERMTRKKSRGTYGLQCKDIIDEDLSKSKPKKKYRSATSTVVRESDLAQDNETATNDPAEKNPISHVTGSFFIKKSGIPVVLTPIQHIENNSTNSNSTPEPEPFLANSLQPQDRQFANLCSSEEADNQAIPTNSSMENKTMNPEASKKLLSDSDSPVLKLKKKWNKHVLLPDYSSTDEAKQADLLGKKEKKKMLRLRPSVLSNIHRPCRPGWRSKKLSSDDESDVEIISAPLNKESEFPLLNISSDEDTPPKATSKIQPKNLKLIKPAQSLLGTVHDNKIKATSQSLPHEENGTTVHQAKELLALSKASNVKTRTLTVSLNRNDVLQLQPSTSKTNDAFLASTLEPTPSTSKTTTFDPQPSTSKENQVLLHVHVGKLKQQFPNIDIEYLDRFCRQFDENTPLATLISQLILTREKSGTELPHPVQIGYPVDVFSKTFVVDDDDDDNPQPKDAFLKEAFQSLQDILPDADPNYLHEKLEEIAGDEDALKRFVSNALENKDYPTREQLIRKQNELMQVKRLTEDFDIEDFLEAVPEPFKYFGTNGGKTPNTQNADRSFLFNRYLHVLQNKIDKTHQKNAHRLYPTCKALDKRKKRAALPDRKWTKYKAYTEIPFLQEVAFINHEAAILDFIEQREEKKRITFAKAKSNNELLTCQCCFDDEVVLEDMTTCNDGHLFCKACVRKGVETQIGMGKTRFPCFMECTEEFSFKTLKEILKPSVFTNIVNRCQLEEVKAAGMEDLETCPFCDYSIIPRPDDKVFTCLNPICMKKSCRLCKEISHIPLRCDEVEKSDEVRARIFIEDRMTKALVRSCWKCDKKFIKEDGCNKMTCTCGALMCYICRKPVLDYTHFNGQGGTEFHKCPLFSNNDLVHVNEVEAEAKKAKEEMTAQNPTVQLKHDPTKILPQPRHLVNFAPNVGPFYQGGLHNWYVDDDEAEDSDEEDQILDSDYSDDWSDIDEEPEDFDFPVLRVPDGDFEAARVDLAEMDGYWVSSEEEDGFGDEEDEDDFNDSSDESDQVDVERED